MDFVKIDIDKFITYSTDKMAATIYSKEVLAKEIAGLEERLANIPAVPSDKELLAWAKVNYPVLDYSKEREYLEKTIAEKEALLAIK